MYVQFHLVGGTAMLKEQDYLDEIQARICHKCVDGDGRGNCLLSKDSECMIERFFPQILEVVRMNYSASMEPYEAALRQKVCSTCINQSSDGKCVVREDLECSLDRYFPLIVQAIEELDLRKRLSKSETGWT
jgi:hypothetical protein